MSNNKPIQTAEGSGKYRDPEAAVVAAEFRIIAGEIADEIKSIRESKRVSLGTLKLEFKV